MYKILKREYRSSDPKVVLSHNPDFFQEKEMQGFFTNISAHAGHTHGGHFGRASILRRLASMVSLNSIGYHGDYVNGVHQFDTDSILEVSAGIGTHPAFGKYLTLPGESHPDHLAIPRLAPRQVTFTTFLCG